MSNLSPEQEEVLKLWMYEGPGKGNFLNEFPKHAEIVAELFELGLVEIRPLTYFRFETVGTNPMNVRDIPRLTEAGAKVKAQLT